MRIVREAKPELNRTEIVFKHVQTGARINAVGGGGDMTKAVYDPNSVAGDAFAMDNMAESATAKVLTDVERTAILANTAKVTFPEAPEDGSPYARQDAGWVAAGGGGSGGGWEFDRVVEVVGSATQEIPFTGLDFTTYEYRVRGIINCTASADDMRAYAVEPDIASVSVANYSSNSSYVTNSHIDSQSTQNRIGRYYSLTNTAWDIQSLRVYPKSDGTIVFDNTDYSVDIVTGGAARTLGLRLLMYNQVKKNATTRFAIYNSIGAFIDPGTKLSLDRRILQ